MVSRNKPKIQRHSGLSNTLPPGSLVWAYLRHSPGEEQTIVSQRRDRVSTNVYALSILCVEIPPTASVVGREAAPGRLLHF